MDLTRRAAVAAAATALAGCGRSFRDNPVPGGLVLRNRDQTARTVAVRAWRFDPAGTPDETLTPGPGGPDAKETFTLDPGATRTAPEFFPGGGRWLVRAVVGDATAELTLRLYDAVPGSAGADTVFVTVLNGVPRIRASEVD